MTVTAVDLERELLRRELERREAEAHPSNFLKHVSALNERTGASFKFNMNDVEDDWRHGQIVQRPEKDWNWQRGLVDEVVEHRRVIALKARQLGVTWLGSGMGLWSALYRPGTQTIFYRQKEDDAAHIVRRAWFQLKSLPDHLLNGATVLKPSRAQEPNLEIDLGFPDGRVSRITGMSSAPSSGHGRVVAFALMDEYAYVESAEGILVAVNSAVGPDGMLLIISTSDGVSNELTGEGNFFHNTWVNAEERKFFSIFLKWDLEPSRDAEWKANDPEYLNLPPWRRPMQYPETPSEAFGTSDAAYFDGEALFDYANNRVQQPLFRGDFVPINSSKATLAKRQSGMTYVYEEPIEGDNYVIGADTATGAGLDYSAACVMSLKTMAIVAEFHGKLDADLYALQLHYLGKWYNGALIAVEQAGGFDQAVILSLRDGREGRPPYQRLYQHRQDTRPDRPQHKPYGFPVNAKTRSPMLEYMEACIRERHIPFISHGLLSEMQTFVRFNPRSREKSTGAWPRAQSGCNDDRVMSTAIALEMYRQRGHFPDRHVSKPKNKYQPSYPWET